MTLPYTTMRSADTVPAEARGAPRMFGTPCLAEIPLEKQRSSAGRGRMRLREDACAAARRSRWLLGQPSPFAEQLLSEARLCEFERGRIIVGVQDGSGSLHFLVKGNVELAVPSIRQEMVVVHLLSPTTWFGELSALSGVPSAAEYRARTYCVTLSIGRAQLSRLQRTQPDSGRALCELISSTAMRMAEIAAEAAERDPWIRVVAKLLSLSSDSPSSGGTCCVPISQAALADICGLSRTTISFVLNDLEKREIVVLGYAKIFISKRDELASILDGSAS